MASPALQEFQHAAAEAIRSPDPVQALDSLFAAFDGLYPDAWGAGMLARLGAKTTAHCRVPHGDEAVARRLLQDAAAWLPQPWPMEQSLRILPGPDTFDVESECPLQCEPLYTGKDPCGVVFVAAARRSDPPASSVSLETAAAILSTALTGIDHIATVADTDPLTGLANRRRLRGTLQRQLQQALAHSTPCSLVLIDVNQLKAINDAHGHAAGDSLLRAMAGGLRDCLRAGDAVFRIGGDEFAAVLPGAGEAAARNAMERVLRAPRWADAIPAAGRNHAPFAFGIAPLDPAHPDRSPEAWLQRADAALYGDKPPSAFPAPPKKDSR